ncbi:MAG: hypothetical protein ACM3JI_00695, partial [Anaerolineae bacterium]
SLLENESEGTFAIRISAQNPNLLMIASKLSTKIRLYKCDMQQRTDLSVIEMITEFPHLKRYIHSSGEVKKIAKQPVELTVNYQGQKWLIKYDEEGEILSKTPL